MVGMDQPATASHRETLRRQMLISYALFVSALYAIGVLSSVSDSTPTDPRGEAVAASLSLAAFVLCLPNALRGWRYVAAVSLVSAAPVAALFFHVHLAAQVWSLIPLMFLGIFVRTWHNVAVARWYVVIVGTAAAIGLELAPAQVPRLWLLLFFLSIAAASEVFGLSHAILRDAADRDPLTGVWNRSGVSRQADALIAVGRRRGQQLAVMILDVDDFKMINDRDGHAAGDRVLVGLTRRWRAQLPRGAVLGRLGGDEFIVLLGGCDEDLARKIAPVLAQGYPVCVTVGMALGRPTDPDDFTALLAVADADLYRRKRQRKAPPASVE